MFAVIVFSIPRIYTDLHFQCEQQFLNLVHVFNHINYSRWGTFQHIYFSSMKHKSPPVYQKLKNVGFTTSQSGGIFNWVDGDYICKCQKNRDWSFSGRLKAGFIKKTKTFKTWIRTKHIAGDMQHMLNQIMNIQILSTHKDSTASKIRKHFNNVNKLKEIRHTDCGYGFFANGPVKMISTGKEVPEDVVLIFRFNDRKQMFYKSCTRTSCNKIKIGIAKVLKKSKPTEVIKKGVQEFGIPAE